MLVGRGGADRFDYDDTDDSTPAAPDLIRDFSRAQGDRIDLRGIDANEQASGNQAFKFIGQAAVHGRGPAPLLPAGRRHVHRGQHRRRDRRRGDADRARPARLAAGHRFRPVAPQPSPQAGRPPMPAILRHRRIAALPLAGLLAGARRRARARPGDRPGQRPRPARHAGAGRRLRRVPPHRPDRGAVEGGLFQPDRRRPVPAAALPLAGQQCRPVGPTDDNDLSKMRVHYRDSDAFGGGAGVQVVLGGRS